MLQGATEEASAAGLHLLVHHAPHTRVAHAFQEVQQGVRLRGVLFASFGEEKLLRRVVGLGIPTVLLDHDVSLPGVHTVRDDSFTAARQAVLDLAALGHRSIALADWRHGELNPWRRDGYREGLRQAGLTRRRQWEIEATLTEAGARQTVERFLALTPRPTALYCFNNSLGRLLVAELRRRGLVVPADVSVVGGGGEEVPDLTCHQADWLQMGRCAVQVLVRALAAPGGPPEHHALPHVPRSGQTTAPPRR
jgi:DNA-binding LacI/PurR family transcriptional regulator